MNNYKKLSGAVSGLTLFAAALVTGPAVATTFDFQLQGGFAPDFSLCDDGLPPGVGSNCLEYDMDAGAGPHVPHQPAEGVPTPIGIAGFSPAIPDGVYDTYQGMQWDRTPFLPGDPVRSRLEITMPSGTISDNGATVDGSQLTHFNRTLSSFDDSLTSSVILETITLYDEGFLGNPAHEVLTLPPVPFAFLFEETPNVAPCPSYQISGVPCDDRFLVFNVQDLKIPFTVDSIDYWLTIDVQDLDIIEDPVFGTVGQLITQESSDNEFKVVLTLAQHGGQIPEPMALAMLGMGLVGFGAWRRRRAEMS